MPQPSRQCCHCCGSFCPALRSSCSGGAKLPAALRCGRLAVPLRTRLCEQPAVLAGETWPSSSEWIFLQTKEESSSGFRWELLLMSFSVKWKKAYRGQNVQRGSQCWRFWGSFYLFITRIKLNLTLHGLMANAELCYQATENSSSHMWQGYKWIPL